MTNEPIPLDIPPGVVKVDSDNATKGRYIDMDKVRFVRGRPQKWGGWDKLITTAMEGKARGAIAWANSTGDQNASFGTHLRLYVVTGGDALTNITPIRDSGTLGADPFTTTNTSTTVSVADTSHGLTQGDYVTFSGATAVGGITIDGEYNVVDVTDGDNYTIIHTSAATSGATGGGASVTYSYEINIGTESAVLGVGWGAGAWGDSTWGTPRASGLAIDLRYWFLGIAVNNLLALPSGGTLYDWTEGTDTEAQAVANAPAAARAMFVTSERFVFLLGTDTPMKVAWPDRDDITDWTPSSTNTSNVRTLQYGSKLIAGTSLTDTINLVWSDRGLYLFQFTGSNIVYDDRLVGQNCGLIAPGAFTSAKGVAFWMSGHDFHQYSGSVGAIPNSEDIQDFVFDNLNTSHTTKVWCEYNVKENEVIWGYPTTSTEPDRYVAVSLDDFSWSVGTLDRTTATLYRPTDSSILMADTDGFIYSHELGNDAESAALEAYIQYGLYALQDGKTNTDLMGFVPDLQRQTGDLSIELATKDRPNSPSNKDTQTVTVSVGDEIEDLRLEGRYFTFTIRSDTVGGDFRMGIPLLHVVPSGERR
jgi:hypothetical protein